MEAGARSLQDDANQPDLILLGERTRLVSGSFASRRRLFVINLSGYEQLSVV
jgi:hypothetical protein